MRRRSSRRPLTGSLTATRDAPLVGAQSLWFSKGTDQGSRYRAGLAWPSTALAARAPEPIGSGTSSRACRRPFAVTRSLPAVRANATVAFDTATLRNGPHAIQASVTDAAGNETRSDPVVVTTRNGSRPNGRGASRFVQLAAWLRSRTAKRRASAVVPYGSVRTVDGRLTDADGRPIAGAVLDVVSRVDRPGARDKRAGTVTTRADGRFSRRDRPRTFAAAAVRVQGLHARPRAGRARRGHARRARGPPAEADAAPGAQRRAAWCSAAGSRVAPLAKARG